MTTSTQLAQEAMEAMKTLDRVFREGSELAVDGLDPKGLAEFRKLRRTWARFHADAGDFADEYVPDVTVLSGGT